MFRKHKIVLSIMLILFIFATVLTGCGKQSAMQDEEKQANTTSTNNEEDVENKEELAGGKITNEPVTLTYFSQFDSSSGLTNAGEGLTFKELEKRTGVKIEFIHPPANQAKEVFNMMVASDDLPDITEGYENWIVGSPDKMVDDGYFLKLNDYIDKYAPNYKKYRESNEEIARQTITDEGNIWAFYNLTLSSEPPWSGMFIRKDWLDDLGLEIPVTIDDWEKTLVAFRDEKGADIGLSMPYDYNWLSNASFASAFGASLAGNDKFEFLNKDGEIVYGPIESGYKDFLELFNKWYDMGILDPEIASRDTASHDAIAVDGRSGAFARGYGAISRYHAAGREKDPDYELIATPAPRLNENDEIHIRQYNYLVGGNRRWISATTKYPEIAVQWCDYAFSDEGFLLYNYGVEGETFTLEDGDAGLSKPFLPKAFQGKVPVFTDLLLNNPDGDFWTILDRYKVHVGSFLRNPLSYYLDDAVLDAMEIWQETADADWAMPPLVLTDDEAQRYSKIMSDVTTEVKETTFKMILGVEPIDNFDSYVERVKALGIEEAISIKEAAYERYMNR